MLTFAEPIVFGRLIKRYQRFFMDVLLDDGTTIVAHTANTGSMMGLLHKDNRVMLSHHQNCARKTAFSVQAIQVNGVWVGINTHLPNKLIKMNLHDPLFEELHSYRAVRAETAYGKDLRSRIDFYFYDSYQNKAPLYLEIKNVTLKNQDHAQFPDAVSLRAQKHIEDLIYVKEQGLEASLFFIVQRIDCHLFSPACQIDQDYAALLTSAKNKGVSIRAFAAQINETGLFITKELPCAF